MGLDGNNTNLESVLDRPTDQRTNRPTEWLKKVACMEIKCWEKEKKTRPYTWQHQLVVGGQWLSCKLNNLPANISRCVIDWQTDRLTEWLVELHVHKNFGLSFGFIHVLTFWHMFLVANKRLYIRVCPSVRRSIMRFFQTAELKPKGDLTSINTSAHLLIDLLIEWLIDFFSREQATL